VRWFVLMIGQLDVREAVADAKVGGHNNSRFT